MKVTILVLLLVGALVAILTGVAFFRGRFRLAATPSETKGHFLLMLKKDKTGEDEKETVQILKNKGRQVEGNVAPPSSEN
jgi:hypothetical protein